MFFVKKKVFFFIQTKSQHFHRSFCSSNKSCCNKSFWDNTAKLGRGVIYSVIKITNKVKYEIDNIICAFINVQICPTIVFQTDPEKMAKSQHFHRSFCSSNKSCHNQSFWDNTVKTGFVWKVMVGQIWTLIKAHIILSISYLTLLVMLITL